MTSDRVDDKDVPRGSASRQVWLKFFLSLCEKGERSRTTVWTDKRSLEFKVPKVLGMGALVAIAEMKQLGFKTYSKADKGEVIGFFVWRDEE